MQQLICQPIYFRAKNYADMVSKVPAHLEWVKNTCLLLEVLINQKDNLPLNLHHVCLQKEQKVFSSTILSLPVSPVLPINIAKEIEHNES